MAGLYFRDWECRNRRMKWNYSKHKENFSDSRPMNIPHWQELRHWKLAGFFVRHTQNRKILFRFGWYWRMRLGERRIAMVYTRILCIPLQNGFDYFSLFYNENWAIGKNTGDEWGICADNLHFKNKRILAPATT